MSAGLLELTELAAASGVPAPRLRGYAESGLLPPARRDGDRLGYPPEEVTAVRMLAGAEDLGFTADTLTGLAVSWRDGDCVTTQQGLADAVAARLDHVQSDIEARNRQAADAGPGSPGWVSEISRSASLSEDAARLQAVVAALTATAHDGPCGESCGCVTALAAAGTTYHFPHDPAAGDGALACDLGADGGDVHHRIGVWQQVLARAESRDPLPDTTHGVVSGSGSRSTSIWPAHWAGSPPRSTGAARSAVTP
ncbi:MerR family transcriptional regulator [Actinoplanes sp. NPDC049118]|uniref:helix-turn-helix domain-containing protein n=1 Tax=Actinoplanes sp. NPDC049118 TaxID=3155769 RepID=UPI0034030A4F